MKSSTLAREWQVLRHSPPGQRFQKSYDLGQREADRSTVVRRVIRLVLAAVALIIGVVLVFIPGPAFVFFAIAGALLATESRAVARVLDWIELRVRQALRWARRLWQGLPLAAKVVVAGVALLVSAAAAYASYRVMFG